MRIDGKHWHVWRARGPLYQRQVDANEAGCIAAVEQHLNSTTNKDVNGEGPGADKNYCCVLVTKNASKKSREWGADYTARVAEEFKIRDSGVVVDPPRGMHNIKFYHCPAILLESGFISNHAFGNRVQLGEGSDALAACLVDSICAMFPDGGLVALSVGHLYRGTGDKGARVNDEGDAPEPEFDDEGELNDLIINAAEQMLLLRVPQHEAPTDPAPPP